MWLVMCFHSSVSNASESSHASKEDFETRILLPTWTILKYPEWHSSYAFFLLISSIDMISATVYVLLSAGGLWIEFTCPIGKTSFLSIGRQRNPAFCNSNFIIVQLNPVINPKERNAEDSSPAACSYQAIECFSPRMLMPGRPMLWGVQGGSTIIVGWVIASRRRPRDLIAFFKAPLSRRGCDRLLLFFQGALWMPSYIRTVIFHDFYHIMIICCKKHWQSSASVFSSPNVDQNGR